MENTQNLCKNGHDKNVVGTSKSGFCRECGRIARRKQWADATEEQREHNRQQQRDRYKTGLTQTRVTKWICKNGHDKREVGVCKNGACRQCFNEKDTARRKNMTGEERERRKVSSRKHYDEWKAGGSFQSDVREYHLRAKYGLEPADFAAMLEVQNGLCAICQQPETRVVKGVTLQLHVDHCHRTKRVRALLCDRCNKGLGMFRDNPDFLIAAAEYLFRFQQE